MTISEVIMLLLGALTLPLLAWMCNRLLKLSECAAAHREQLKALRDDLIEIRKDVCTVPNCPMKSGRCGDTEN